MEDYSDYKAKLVDLIRYDERIHLEEIQEVFNLHDYTLCFSGGNGGYQFRAAALRETGIVLINHVPLYIDIHDIDLDDYNIIAERTQKEVNRLGLEWTQYDIDSFVAMLMFAQLHVDEWKKTALHEGTDNYLTHIRLSRTEFEALRRQF